MADQPLGARFARGVGWELVNRSASQAFSLLIFLLLARMLGPEPYGVVAYAGVFLAVLQLMVEQGLGMVLLQRKDLDRATIDTAFLANAIGAAATFVICWLFAGAVAVFLTGEALAAGNTTAQVAEVIPWLAAAVCLTNLAVVPQAVIERDLKQKLLALRTLLSGLAGTVVGVGLALWGAGVWSLVGQQLAAAIVNLVVLWRAAELQPGGAWSRAAWRSLLVDGWPIFLQGCLDLLNRRLDQFLVGRYAGHVALGAYSIAQRMYLLALQLSAGSVARVSTAALAKLRGEPERLTVAYGKVLGVVAWATLPAFAVLAPIAHDLAVGLLGTKWDQAGTLLGLLTWAGPVHAVAYFTAATLVAIGRQRLRLGLSSIAIGLNVLTYIIAMPYGIEFMLIVYVTRCWLWLPIELLVTGRTLGTGGRRQAAILLRPLLVAALAAAAAWAVVHWARPWSPHGLLTAALGALAGGIVAGSGVLLLGRQVIRDVKEVMQQRKQKPAAGSPATQLTE